MEERFLFYWSLWLLFVIVFFFMNQVHLRRVFLIFILLSLMSVTFFLSISQLIVNLNIIIWLTVSMYLLCLDKHPVKITFFSCVFSCFYLGLLWWKMTAPVWFMYLNGIEISVLICIFVGLLCDNFFERANTLLVGSTIGNIVYDGMLVYMQLDTQIGQLGNYMYLHFSLLILLFIYAIKRTMHYVWFHMREVN